jgi:hypothetical protein
MRHLDAVYRPMDPAERSLVEFLLRHSFPGRDELLIQMEGATVKTIDENGSLSFETADAKPAAVKHRIPIEASSPDTDAVVIHILLHIVHGYLSELEIYKDDSSIVNRTPRRADLILFCPTD